MNNVFDNLSERFDELLKQKDTTWYPQLSEQFLAEVAFTGKQIRGYLLSIENDTQLKAYFTFAIQQLCTICDALYELAKNDIADPAVLAILEVIGKLKQTMPSLVDRNMALPKAFRMIHAKRFENDWQEIKDSWHSFNIKPHWLEMSYLPLIAFADTQEKLSWFHFTWMKRYFSMLRNLNFNHFSPLPKPENLIDEVLVRMNFNSARFMVHCSEVIAGHLRKYKAKEEQIYVIKRAQKTIAQLPLMSAEPFHQYASGTVEHINSWLEKEEEFRSNYDLEFFKETGERMPLNPWKFKYNWNAEQIAYWFKLQVDNGLLKPEKLSSFTRCLSYNCSSSAQDNLTPKSFLSKLYSKDMHVLSPIYDAVCKMIDDTRPILDELVKMKEGFSPYMKYR